MQAAPSHLALHAMANVTLNPTPEHCKVECNLLILTCHYAVVDGLSERPRKRSVSSAALARLRLEDDKLDPQRFTHVASISGRELDWISSQEKLACLLQTSVSRCAYLAFLVGSALYMQINGIFFHGLLPYYKPNCLYDP